MTTPDQRRARRAWIAQHHPDRGGDPATFMSGLAGFPGGHDDRPAAPADHRLTVVRSAGAARAAKRAWRRVLEARRRHTHHGTIE